MKIMVIMTLMWGWNGYYYSENLSAPLPAAACAQMVDKFNQVEKEAQAYCKDMKP